MNGRPLLVELVGLAGAGKTTLEQVISQRDQEIQAVFPPHKARYVPFLINTAFLWLPIYLRQYRHSRWFTWKEIRLMAYLQVWPRYLRRQIPRHSKVAVLNPGSVYWLAALRELGPPITTSQLYKRWWNSMLGQWATLLDMVIWLDSPDRILLERIHTRDEWHEAKEQPQQETLQRFARLRTCYREITSTMTANCGPRVLRFRTDQSSPDQIADRVLAVLNLEDGQSKI